MGSHAFDRDQLRLAWVAVGGGFVWLFYYVVIISAKWSRMTGNNRKLIKEHTRYDTYWAWAWGEHTLGMALFFIVVCSAAVLFVYRGYRDEWQFLHE